MAIEYKLDRHAVQFAVTLQIPRSEFAEYKSRKLVLPTQLRSPRELTEDEQDCVHWQELITEQTLEHTGKELMFFADVQVRNQPDDHLVTGIVYFRPELESPLDELMTALAKEFLAPSTVTEAQVTSKIEMMLKSVRFHSSNLIPDTDKRPIAAGDYLSVAIEGPDGVSTLNVVGMTPDCPRELYDGLINKAIGDTVIVGWDDGNGHRRVKLHIHTRIKIRELTEEDFLRIESCATMQELRQKVKRQLETGHSVEFQRQFDRILLTHSRLGPVPETLIYDRTEGYVQALSMNRPDYLKQLQVQNRDQAIEVSLPAVMLELRRELLALYVCENLGIPPTKAEIAQYISTNELPDTWDTRWVARTGVAYTKALQYYRSKGQDHEFLK
jgi:hypothetical protein